MKEVGIYLNPGNEGFCETIRSKIYVDKTELIQHTNELINTKQKYVCVSRPRRFGKTMTVEMLTAYYEKDCDSATLFAPFKITNSESYKKHINQYNVVALNMKKILSVVYTVDELIAYIQTEILEELKETYHDVIPQRERFLNMALERVYQKMGRGFVFIIDEWDCILREKQYALEEHKKYLDFMQGLLKDQNYVALAYMTGILPIKKYGTHSALNMFDEYSMIDAGNFAPYVGFTEQEVETLCNEYQIDFEKEKEWYDGYVFESDLHIYSPKSVVDSIRRNEFASYWTQTETYEALKIYIKMNYDGLKDAIIQMLAGDKVKIDYGTFQNDMTTFESRDDVLTLLVHLGYLAYQKETCQVCIPNAEVRAEFVRAVKGCNWQEVIQSIEKSEQLLQATWNKDSKMIAEQVEAVHMANTSILNYNDENALSCVISLAYYNAINEYTLIREMPSGKGYADMIFLPRCHSDKPAMVVELKYNKSAEGAIAQIKEKQYAKVLEEYQGNLLLVGINYDQKTKKHTCVMEEVMKG